MTEETFIPFHYVTGNVRSFHNFYRCMCYTAEPWIGGHGRKQLSFLDISSGADDFCNQIPFQNSELFHTQQILVPPKARNLGCINP